MKGKDWIHSTARTVLYAYAYVALEWLFFVTKPSFLDTWPWSSRLNALLMGAIPVVLATLALHLTLCLATLLVSRIPRLTGAAAIFLRVTPALVGMAIVLILVDNFTYTMFGWGIVDTTIHTAPIYWAACLLVFVLQLRRIPAQPGFAPWTAGALIVVTAICTSWTLYRSADVKLDDTYTTAWSGGPLPNIIVFASDGIPADHLSAYGYSRKTTPNLDGYLDTALVADNAFTNGSGTTASLSSLMTGKYPTTTKLLLSPQTLDGIDAYQSLPRILRKLGYTNLQETLRFYADGPDLNWKESFDFANGREVTEAPLNRTTFALMHPLQFSGQLQERLSERVEQLLFIKQMANPHVAVVDKRGNKLHHVSDKARMGQVADFVRSAKGPFFIHIHLLETHCCKLKLPAGKRHFSNAAFKSSQDRDTAIFDDTILRSDQYFGQMMALLKQRGLLDNTLIIYTSDHDKGWDFRSPVPLIFFFPDGKPHGHIAATTQLLDVAPTILDYIKVKVPAWMEGQSLLHGDLKRDRPVFSMYRVDLFSVHGVNGDRTEMSVGPPDYGLQQMGLIVCHRWYLMDVVTGSISSGEVGDFENPTRAAPGAPLTPPGCTAGDIPGKREAGIMLKQHLVERGFGL